MIRSAFGVGLIVIGTMIGNSLGKNTMGIFLFSGVAIAVWPNLKE